jgi:hypothetical protein
LFNSQELCISTIFTNFVDAFFHVNRLHHLRLAARFALAAPAAPYVASESFISENAVQ